MSARATAALAVAAAVMLALLVAKVMSVSIMAGTLLACALAVAVALGAAYVLMATGKGQHVAPRGYAEADERLADTSERLIPRAITEHDPPWEPAFQAAPVLEPDAVTSGPPDEPQPDAWIVATATLSGGQVTSVQYAAGTAAYVDEKIRTGMGLPPWVAEDLGYPTVDAAVEALSAPWHSVDSIFNGADVRQVRALTDGAS